MGTGVGEMMFYALASHVVSEMSAPSIPKVTMPKIEEKPVIETPDPLAQDAAKRKSLVEQMQRSGRASTIMTDNAGTLGG